MRGGRAADGLIAGNSCRISWVATKAVAPRFSETVVTDDGEPPFSTFAFSKALLSTMVARRPFDSSWLECELTTAAPDMHWSNAAITAPQV